MVRIRWCRCAIKWSADSVVGVARAALTPTLAYVSESGSFRPSSETRHECAEQEDRAWITRTALADFQYVGRTIVAFSVSCTQRVTGLWAADISS